MSDDDAVAASVPDATMPDEQLVVTDGARLRVLDWGTVGRPPVMLLHGVTTQADRWERQARAWRHVLHIVTLDLLGDGDSRLDHAGQTTVDTLAVLSAGLPRVADALGWRSFAVVGHATGGTIATSLAADHPGRVERLVIADTAPLDLWPRLQDIHCPTLLVRGTDSEALPQEIAERMMQEIADCRLVVVPPAGHAVGDDEAAIYESAIRDFLLGKEPAGAIRPEWDIG